MSEGSNRVTLVHVAQAAGVALSTASHAFGVDTPISPATRARVLAAADDLGYQGPDPSARSLRSGRTGIIGVQVDDETSRAFRDPVIIGILDGISAALAAGPESLLLIPDSLPPERMRTIPVDGVIAAGCSANLPQLRAIMARRRVPVITAGNQVDDVACVGVENRAATALLTDHLAQLGHRRVGVVRLPGGSVEAARTAATRSAFPECATFGVSDSTIDQGIAAGAALLSRRSDITAIIAQSDLLAVGVIRAAHERGLRVPEDLSVTGFDGIKVDGFSQMLTTVRQPITDMGRLAARAVLDALDGAPLPRTTMGVDFVRGETTGPVGPIRQASRRSSSNASASRSE